MFKKRQFFCPQSDHYKVEKHKIKNLPRMLFTSPAYEQVAFFFKVLLKCYSQMLYPNYSYQLDRINFSFLFRNPRIS